MTNNYVRLLSDPFTGFRVKKVPRSVEKDVIGGSVARLLFYPMEPLARNFLRDAVEPFEMSVKVISR